MCSFIRTEFDTRVSKATSCSVDLTVSVKLMASGPVHSPSAGVCDSVLFSWTADEIPFTVRILLWKISLLLYIPGNGNFIKCDSLRSFICVTTILNDVERRALSLRQLGFLSGPVLQENIGGNAPSNRGAEWRAPKGENRGAEAAEWGWVGYGEGCPLTAD